MNTQEDITKLKKQFSFLTRYAVSLTLILGAIGLTFLVRNFNPFSTSLITDFDEINVKKINIIEEDGKLRLSISNKERSIANLYKGKPIGIPGGNRPGFIFFDDEESEIGGLVFSGVKDPENGDYFQSGHLSFDQYNQNQTLYLQYLDDNGSRKVGLYVDDWQETPPFHEFRKTYKEAEKLPDGPEKENLLKELMEPKEGQKAFANRVFVGKDKQKSAVLNLSDRMGVVRLQLKVDSLGIGNINFFNAQGVLTTSFPPKQ